MSEHTAFLTMFPGCARLRAAAGGLDQACVTEVRIHEAEGAMTVCARFAAMPSPAELRTLSELLRADYGLQTVEIEPDYPRPKAAPAAEQKEGGAPSGGSVLFGKAMW